MRKLAYAATLVAASLFATSAQAAQSLVITGPSGTFGDDSVTCGMNPAPCAFTRNFNFVTPAGFTLTSIDISSVATSNPLTNIDFTTVTFNGVNFNLILSGTQEFRNLLNQTIVAGGNNTIAVTGTSGGGAAFSGGLSFAAQAAVPEPGTWAMMLLGFGAIGFAMRRRRQPLLQLA